MSPIFFAKAKTEHRPFVQYRFTISSQHTSSTTLFSAMQAVARLIVSYVLRTVTKGITTVPALMIFTEEGSQPVDNCISLAASRLCAGANLLLPLVYPSPPAGNLEKQAVTPRVERREGYWTTRCFSLQALPKWAGRSVRA